MSKTKLLYYLDVVIALAFILAAVTGIAFLVMGDGGYQGGRNPIFKTEWLGISRETWDDLHTLSSLVMIAGVGYHLVLHWRWLVNMTTRCLPKRGRNVESEECNIPVMN